MECISENAIRIKFFKYYGLLLEDIMNVFKIKTNRNQAKDKIHEAIKEYYNIESVADLSTEKLRILVNKVRMVFAREFGILLKEPREPDGIHKMEMKEFLKLKLK